MNKKLRFLARPGFVVRQIVGENMLVPVDTGRIELSSRKELLPEFNGIISLNEVALFLWNLLQQPRTLDDLLNEIQKEFDVGEDDDTQEDVMQFLEQGIVNQIIFILDDGPDE